MGKKIRIYESEIKRATRRKLMENYLDEMDDQEMSGSLHRRDFKPTPREKDVMSVFGDMYGEDIPPVVIRYMRKNPDHVLRRLSKIYPEIYMRHVPLESNIDLEMEDGILDEEVVTNVKKIEYSPEEVKNAEREGMGISVNGSVILDKNGGMTVTTKNESTQKLFKRFLNKK